MHECLRRLYMERLALRIRRLYTRPAMKPSLHSRAGYCLLLLGLALQLVVPVALEPDHYLEHHPTAQQTAEDRVSLHGQDGDHHHESARLELGEKSSHPHCALCAQFGKSSALLIKRLGMVATLDARSASLPEAAFVAARLGKEPCQPRAPPRV